MKSFDNYKLTGETAIKDFPAQYNKLVADLLEEIGRLNGIISEQNATISDLENRLISAVNVERSEYINMFDKLDEKYVKKGE